MKTKNQLVALDLGQRQYFYDIIESFKYKKADIKEEKRLRFFIYPSL